MILVIRQVGVRFAYIGFEIGGVYMTEQQLIYRIMHCVPTRLHSQRPHKHDCHWFVVADPCYISGFGVCTACLPALLGFPSTIGKHSVS
jgi:hypothetical protein